MKVASRESKLETIYANARVLDEETVDDVVISSEDKHSLEMKWIKEKIAWLDNATKECKLALQTLNKIEKEIEQRTQQTYKPEKQINKSYRTVIVPLKIKTSAKLTKCA